MSPSAVVGTTNFSQEVAGYGISGTVIEPGAFATEFGSSSAYSAQMPEYDGVREAFMSSFSGIEMGDPAGFTPRSNTFRERARRRDAGYY